MNIRFVYLVKDNKRMPHAWLGLAWYNFDQQTAVCMVVPFNLIARWARDAWIGLRLPRSKGYVERQVESSVHVSNQVWQSVVSGAEQRAYERGITHGRQQLRNDIIADLDARREASAQKRLHQISEEGARINEAASRTTATS